MRLIALASRYFCFKYLDSVKSVIIHASDTAKRLSINVLVILWISTINISTTEGFTSRNCYLYLLKVADKLCCLRPWPTRVST